MSTTDQTTLRRWLRERLAEECSIAPAQVDPRAPFGRLGLGSLAALRIVAALSERLGRRLPATLMWEHASVDALLGHLLPTDDAERASAGAGASATPTEEPIAIVGMACRLPQAADVEALWELLREGVCAVSEVPAARGWGPTLATLEPGERDTARRGAFLERVDEFEPLFFGISPREARAMDPQQRLMLELCWEALEDAGIRPGALVGTPTGVFAGAIWSEYDALLYQDGPAGLGPYTVTGGHRSILANRVSYTLGLQGPSFTLDSACSSGLVVVHLACDSLRRGESSVALAGAVNLNLLPESSVGIARFGALSKDGRCHTFDADANGYVRGEGGGVVVLKRLSRALADGDPIRALIRGSAVNNDGASNGLTAPSGAAQESLLAAAYRRAGVARGEVQYVEAHGTGTPLGDPIEARALAATLAADRPAGAPLRVGSIKTNIGHLEGAAGIAGLLKTALAIERRALPPSLHFTRDNPHAPLAELGLAVPRETGPWPQPGQRLTAGVSSFGLGGTNCHVVLQEWPGPVPTREPAVNAARVDADGPAPEVAFVFPGQGAQWPGMAWTLLRDEPVIRATLAACDRHIRALAGWSLLEELAAPEAASRLGEIEISLPAIISLDIAVSAWWRARGLEPAAVVGHSTGEIAAAHVAGALDLADTMRVICAYGEFVGRLSGRGGMAYLGLSWAAAADALQSLGFAGRVFRAIQDSAAGTVVAGAPSELAELGAALEQQGVFWREVSIPVGPHSPLVDSVRDGLRAALQGIRPRATRVPLVSEVTGEEVPGESLDPEHWVRNFGDSAYFSRAVDTLIARGHRVFLEVGPHPITRHAIETNLRRAGATGQVIASLRRGEDGRVVLREAAAALADAGVVTRADEDGRDDGNDVWLLPVSARGAAALQARARGYAERLRQGARVEDVVFTASARREALPRRAAVVGRTRAALIAGLETVAADVADAPARESPPLTFVFSGQGSQWAGMGQRLRAEEPVFRAWIDECDALLRRHVPWSLGEELAAPAGRSRLAETERAQPAIFAVQVGIARLLQGWGVEPDAVIGHSVGELAAAYVAGALPLDEALRVVALRGRVMQRAPAGGRMAWVALPREQAARAIASRRPAVVIAAVNDPDSVVLSGAEEALRGALAELSARGVQHRMVRVNYAFHSPQMDALADDFADALGAVRTRPATVPMRSTVTGAPVDGPELDASYWARNIRQPVELARAVTAAVEAGSRLLLEVGPHPVLVASLTRCVASRRGELGVVHTLRRDGDGPAELRRALGQLWARGRAVDFAALQPRGGRVVSLPTYPWQRARYWVEGADAGTRRLKPRPGPGTEAGGLLGAPFVSALHPDERAWELPELAAIGAWMSAWRVGGRARVPAIGWIELLRAAGDAIAGRERGAELLDLSFESPDAELAGPVQLAAVTGGETSTLTIARREGDGWTRLVGARLQTTSAPLTEDERPQQAVPEVVRGRCTARRDGDELWARLERGGAGYEPALRCVDELWIGEGEALARVCRPAETPARAAALAGGLQAAQALLLAREGVTAPVSCVSLRLDAALESRASGTLWAHARGDRAGVDITLLDADGRVLGALRGLVSAPLVTDVQDPAADCVHELVWRAQEPSAGARARAPGSWLLLADAGGLASRLAAALRSRGEACELVRSVDALAQRLSAGCDGVIHCASLDAADWARTGPETLEADTRRGTLAAIELAQAIVRFGFRDPPRLVIVTRGAQSVAGEPVAPAQAPVWGMTRTLALEHPELRCLRVDLDLDLDLELDRDLDAATERVIESLVHELLDEDGEEDQVALRAGGRYVARLARGQIVDAEDDARVELTGSYLITGGLGGLGLTLARWLVERGVRGLALMGRRPPSASARAVIATLEEAGARVRALQGDVTRAADVARALETITGDPALPPLRGVVHAAGVRADSTVMNLSEETFWSALRPKLLGAWNLHAATRERSLRYFVMFSSIAAALGSPGQAAYAAGNAFLDALARARAARGAPALSVQWGPFSELGMAAALDPSGRRMAARGLERFAPDEGIALLGRWLERGPAETAGSPATVGLFRLSLRRWLESTPQAAGMRYLEELPREPVAQAAPGIAAAREELRAQLAGRSPDEQAAVVERRLTGLITQVLQLAPGPIDRRAPFASLGLDSLTGLELRNRIERGLGVSLQPTLLFTYPDLESLAGYLLERLRPAARDEPAPGPEDELAPAIDESDMSPGSGEEEGDALLAAFDASMRSLDEEELL